MYINQKDSWTKGSAVHIFQNLLILLAYTTTPLTRSSTAFNSRRHMYVVLPNLNSRRSQ